jgi:uncharacterized phosphosugar-binding protein
MLPYFQHIQTLLQEAERKNAPVIAALAEQIAASVIGGGVLHIFGTGHSHMLAEEVFYRAGGLIPVNAMLDARLMLHEGALSSTLAERLTGYAEAILIRYDLRAGETLIIASNSGRNAVPVEMALLARSRGLSVIALTSVAHSMAHESRHPSGKRLYEIADHVLDNCGAVGDAALPLEGTPYKVGATSTVIGVALLQALVHAIAQRLVEKGVDPVPVLVSSNLDAADPALHNQTLLEKYRPRLPHL